jgi:hypothetical protein
MNKYEAKYRVKGLYTARFREFTVASDEQALEQARGLATVVAKSLGNRETELVSLHRLERHEVDINE